MKLLFLFLYIKINFLFLICAMCVYACYAATQFLIIYVYIEREIAAITK